MTTGFWLSYTALCCLQGLLVLTPLRVQPRSGFRVVGLVVPALLLALGVLLVQELSGGARALTDLATFGTPIAAGLCGFLLGWRPAWLAPILAVGLYLVAWQAGGLVGDGAGVLLIAGACLSGAALLGRVAGQRELAIGLVLLVVLDVILVFGTSQVQQTTTALHAVAPPNVHIAGNTRHLPALQDATFGSALMGWLDLLAPALLGMTLIGSQRRRVAALAVTAAALTWGTLLYLTPEIPATVPVLIGLTVASWPSRSRRTGLLRSLRAGRAQGLSV